MSDTITTPHTEIGSTQARDMRPPGLLAGFAPIFSWGLRLQFRRRRFFVVLALAIGTGLFLGFNVVNVGSRLESEGLKDKRLWELLDGNAIQYLMPLCALIFVAGGFAREVSERTLVYHLVRPIRRHTIFLARFLSGLVPGTVVMTALLAAILMGSQRPIPDALWFGIVPLSFFGMLVLGSLYYTLASLFKRGAIGALAYTFVIEGLIVGRGGSSSNLALTHHIRALKRDLLDASLAERSTELRDHLDVSQTTMERLSQVTEANAEALMRAAAQPPVYGTAADAILAIGLIAGALLLFGAWRISQRDFPLKD